MSANAGMFGIPGTSAAVFNVESELYWGGDRSKVPILMFDGQISSAAVDSGSTPTNVLRKGLLLGKITSSGLLKEWNPDGSDGSENFFAVNSFEQRMVDSLGTAVNRFAGVTIGAPVKASAMLIEGSAMVGHVDEYLARRQMVLAGFRFDDDPMNWLAGFGDRQSVKATNYTVVAADNGTRFIAITADATFTLPALKAGLRFEFLRASDHEIVVASAEGDNIIVGNDLSADSITFTAAGEQIGARVAIEGIYMNGTLKWLPSLPYTPFGTGTATLTFALAT